MNTKKEYLVEKNALGGDCLNVGCVPSKALLCAAKSAAAVRRSDDFGVRGGNETKVDFVRVMQRMRQLRSKISSNDSAKRFQELGIDVFLGKAEFKNNRTIRVDDQELNFAKAVVATGARAVVLPIPGLKEAGALTNETIFSLIELPKRFAVIGAGPIGCEMAQAFERFGSQVTLFEADSRILPREDPQAAEGAPVPENLPANLASAPANGCRIFRNSEGAAVSLICLEIDDELVHVFIFDKSHPLSRNLEHKRWASNQGWNLFSWEESDTVMAMVSKRERSDLHSITKQV